MKSVRVDNGARQRSRFVAALLASGCVMSLVAPAAAQTVPTTDPAETSGKLPASQADAAPATTSVSSVDQAVEDQPSGDEIVVTGIRASLASSLETKRRAQNMVDSISAEEAGKFPDNNLAESLQRLPGVAVVRSFGLGQQISVRGLGPDFQNVLLNGRSLPSDTGAWSADGGGRGRSFNFDVLPSEMISRVEINKTSLPSLTEGGIGSTINIVTPRPLAAGKNFATIVATGNWVERRNTITPTVVGIGSWANEADTFGVAISGSYTNILASRDSVRVDQWDGLPRAAGDPTPQSTFNVLSGTGDAIFASKRAFTAPRQMNYAKLTGGTERYFAGGTVQFRPAPSVTITGDGFYSHLNQNITEASVTPRFGNTVLNPNIGAGGVLQSGQFPGQTVLNSAAVQRAITSFNIANPTNLISIDAPQARSVIRERNRKADTYQVGLNGKWEASDNLTLEADASYSKATGDKPFDPYVLIGRYAQGNVGFSLDDSKNPVASLDDAVFSDKSLVRVGYSGNWGQTIDDHIFEGRVGGDWKSDEGVFRGLSAGADYQDHTKGLENFYAGANPYDGFTFVPDTSLLDVRSFGKFLDGKVSAPVSSFFGYNPRQFMDYLSQPAQLARCTNNPPTCASDTTPYDLIFDQGGSFDTRERVLAGYVDGKLGGDWWSLNGGVRVVHVKTRSSGFAGALISAIPTSNGSYNITTGNGQPVSSSASYTSVLPSANLKINATDDLVLRLAASRTLTRADLNDLRYGLNFGGSVPTFTLSAGNPGLKPMYGKNYDASVEWYLSKVSYLSVAGFRKDLTDLFDTAVFDASTSTFAPGANAPATVRVTQLQNVSKGRIQGAEVAAQLALDERAGWASGFGVSGNYTYVDSKAETASGCFAGISPHSYNASGFYDNGKVQVRGAYNWRSKWVTACSWDVTGQPQRHASYGQWDLSFRANLTQQIQIFADVVNLTNSRNRLYFLDNTPIQIDVNYRRADFGMRVSF